MHYFGNVANYIACSNPHTTRLLGIENIPSTAKRKAIAIEKLIEMNKRFLKNLFQTNDLKKLFGEEYLSIGFSDDSVNNVQEVYKKLCSIQTDEEKMSVYFTGKNEDRK